MSYDNKHDPYDSRGPGHTKWFIDDEGEVMRVRWNDKSWTTRTRVFLDNELVGKNTSRNDILKLIRDAYEEGMRDQLTKIKTILEIK